ncbi:MAG: indole-3-glycerol-phosphate synthase [Candidatus Helarchaeota archaeon]
MTVFEEIINRRRKTIKNELKKYKNYIKRREVDNRSPISDRIKADDISIISEIKISSPSQGKLREELDLVQTVKEMESGGVIGLSVLTEPDYFNGSFENLKVAVETTELPCLMKDFVIDEIQLMIANGLGARNVLLINKIGNIEEMYQKCIELELEPLIEIHSIEELKDIENLYEIGINPRLIGVNNRDLDTLKVDLNNSRIIIPELKRMCGEKIKVISESGIYTRKDVEFVSESGADAILVGTSIMKADNVKEKIYELRGLI